MMKSNPCRSAVAVDVIGITPPFPVLRECRSGGIASEEECNDALEDGLVVAYGDVLSDAFKGEDLPKCPDKRPESRQRRRTFHIV